MLFFIKIFFRSDFVETLWDLLAMAMAQWVWHWHLREIVVWHTNGQFLLGQLLASRGHGQCWNSTLQTFLNYHLFRDLNQRTQDYKAKTLPTELQEDSKRTGKFQLL